MSTNQSLALVKYKFFMDNHHISDLKVFNLKTDQDRFDYLEIGEPPKKRISLKSILNEICLDSDIKNNIINNKRDRSLTIYKITFIQNASFEGYSLNEIGLFLNTSKAAVHQLKQKGLNYGNYS